VLLIAMLSVEYSVTQQCQVAEKHDPWAMASNA
jgi:hypothetical protein